MALGMGFSSNMIVFGSLAGIVVVEEARKRDVDIILSQIVPLRPGRCFGLHRLCGGMALVGWPVNGAQSN
jgi:hypothetical protein